MLNCPKPQSFAFKMRTVLTMSPAECRAPFPPLLSFPMLRHSTCPPPHLVFMLAQALSLPSRTHPYPLRTAPHTRGRAWDPCLSVSCRERGRGKEAACDPVGFLYPALVPDELHSLPLDFSIFLIFFSFGLKLRFCYL